MIYTVTFNPSLDYLADVKNFQWGLTNRTEKEIIHAGGKGINVSFVLRNLGIESRTFGFVAGFTGAEIERRIREEQIEADFIHVLSGMSRINMKLRTCDDAGKKEETEINGMGPAITDKDMEKLYKKLDLLNKGDILVLAGSIPVTVPPSVYRNIMERLKDREVDIVVDATGDLLINVLEFHPFLIKPNVQELCEIFHRKITTTEEVISCAEELRMRGARNVIVSMAGDGAVFAGGSDCIYQCDAPQGMVVNSVGAGDSMVAGFIAGYVRTGSVREAFKMGVCTGSASAFSETFATLEQVERLRQNHPFNF